MTSAIKVWAVGVVPDVTGWGFAVSLGEGRLGEVVLGVATTRSSAWAMAESGGADLADATLHAWDGRWTTVIDGRSARRMRAAS